MWRTNKGCLEWTAEEDECTKCLRECEEISAIDFDLKLPNQCLFRFSEVRVYHGSDIHRPLTGKARPRSQFRLV